MKDFYSVMAIGQVESSFHKVLSVGWLVGGRSILKWQRSYQPCSFEALVDLGLRSIYIVIILSIINLCFMYNAGRHYPLFSVLGFQSSRKKYFHIVSSI